MDVFKVVKRRPVVLPLAMVAAVAVVLISEAGYWRSARTLNEITAAQKAVIASRSRNVIEQMMEFKGLRGKNQNVIEHMMKRVDAERKEFDESLIKMQGTRAVFTKLSMEVYTSLGMDILREEIRKSREAMEKSNFSSGLTDAVKTFFGQIKLNLLLSISIIKYL